MREDSAGSVVNLQHHEDGQCRNRPCGYTPYSKTINANGKESHNGRQRWEKGKEQDSETESSQTRATGPEEAGEATEEHSVRGTRIRARKDPNS